MIFLLIGYMFLFVHRPFEVWPELGAMRIERVYMIAILLFWFFFHNKYPTFNRAWYGLIAVLLGILIPSVMCETSTFDNKTVDDWVKIFIFAVLIMLSIRNETESKILFTGFLVVFLVYMLHSLFEFKFRDHFVYRMGTKRMIGIEGSDPNAFGASVDYAIPLLLPLWSMFKGWKAILPRIFCVIFFLVGTACVIYTGSRSSFIALIFYLFIATMISKHRLKIILALMIISPIVWFQLPTELQNRYMTIIDPSRGPANAQASAEGRIDGLKTGLALWKKHPFFGVGPGETVKHAISKHQSHNLIGQIMGELGIVGATGYLIMIGVIIANYISTRFYYNIHHRIAPDGDFYYYYISLSVFIVLWLLLLLGMGGHNAYRYTWIWYVTFQAIAAETYKKQINELIAKLSKSGQLRLLGPQAVRILNTRQSSLMS